MLGRMVLLYFAFLPLCSIAQDSSGIYERLHNFPDKFFSLIDRKSEKLQKNLTAASLRYINKLEKQEIRLKNRLARKDSSTANNLFADIKGRYSALRALAIDPGQNIPPAYSGHLDSIQTTLKFLDSYKILAKSGVKIPGSLNHLNDLQKHLSASEFLKVQLLQRQELISAKINELGLLKEFKKFRKTVYYYRSQLDEYQRIFEDQDKVQSLVLSAVAMLPAFKKYFARYSQLGSLFALPGASFDQAALGQMQTRAMLSEELGQRLGAGANTSNMVSSSISGAQSVLQQVNSRLAGTIGNGEPATADLKLNNLKTKTFFRRLDVGMNMQSTKKSYFFPSTTDWGVFIGYKFRENIIAGIGGSYKMGWGSSFRHIRISHQGVGLRTYFDVKAKGSFWATAGGEYNYRSGFRSIEELRNENSWQKSLLAGLNKKVQMKNRKAEFRLLYDFLYRRQRPEGQPLIFRIGYSLK